MLGMDFVQSIIGPHLCYLTYDDENSFLIIYVNEISYNHGHLRYVRKNTLDLSEKCFKIKRLGPALWILLLYVTQSPRYITLDQFQYIKEILHRYGVDNCNSASTPMAPSATLRLDDHTLP